ncbi:MAG TPA: YihY/virulence factor BrkB family protein [Longimicrobium sp.]|nr:YihY/virulence factor BrkB family protein [Longimicrobium sp.]
MRVPGLRGLRVRTVAVETYRAFDDDDMWSYAASVAYQVLFALFPFLLFLLAVFSFLNQAAMFEWLLGQGRRVLPADAYAQVHQVVEEVRGQREGGLLSLGVATTLWIASGGVRSAMNALNRAHDVPEGRVWWKRYLLSFAYTIALGLAVVLATVMMVAGPRATAWALDRVGAGQGVQDAIAWLRVPGALLLVGGALFLVYLALPNVRQRPRLVVPGAVAAVLLWALVSFGFQLYVANFGRFAVTYGSVGAVIMLLAYFYLASAIVLLGAELNAVLQREAPRPGDAEPREVPPPDSPGQASRRRRLRRFWRRAAGGGRRTD